MNMKSKLGLALIAITMASPLSAAKAKKSAATAKKAVETKKLEADVASSQIKWLGKKVTGQHDGTIALKNGTFEVAGDQLVGGTFEVDMTTLVVTDIKDTETNAKLLGHLKSDDFFSTEKNPTSTLKIKSVTPLAKPEAGKTSHEIAGDLTIKGIKKSITFPALIEMKDNVVHAKGTMTIDRTKYSIKYGSGKFFKGLGDKVISDTFTLDLDVSSKATQDKVATN